MLRATGIACALRKPMAMTWSGPRVIGIRIIHDFLSESYSSHRKSMEKYRWEKSTFRVKGLNTRCHWPLKKSDDSPDAFSKEWKRSSNFSISGCEGNLTWTIHMVFLVVKSSTNMPPFSRYQSGNHKWVENRQPLFSITRQIISTIFGLLFLNYSILNLFSL